MFFSIFFMAKEIMHLACKLARIIFRNLARKLPSMDHAKTTQHKQCQGGIKNYANRVFISRSIYHATLSKFDNDENSGAAGMAYALGLNQAPLRIHHA
jgi:hypothetical protein